ncbi:hypothetical protein IVA79_03030 [Bradyrhizobium sp. 138]|uniref:hypothetical protein n=1 Tax=Bradyrhizobium sp. 138 TaxID=2782615 RepID=UPI001FFB05B5|nr:hypothetical protein [Bradyrhizobium sp. 138]MCK1732952.1 hypothetical protein [Bradyrhizobium sp. 138]
MPGSGNSSLARSTSFKKGTRKPTNSGRTKGARNKTTLILKEAALLAAEACGEDGKGTNGLVGFLTSLAQQQPAVFGRLLERILPMQFRNKAETTGVLSADEAAQRLRERGLPVPSPFHKPDFARRQVS